MSIVTLTEVFTIIAIKPDGKTFPCYKPLAKENSSSRIKPSWWIEIIYVDSILGLAQITRDPGLARDQPPTYQDLYFGMPTPFGSFTFDQDVTELVRPNHTDMLQTHGSSSIKAKKK